MTPFPGKCHCGKIAFTFETALAPENWSVRACQCSFCRMHDALSTSDMSGVLHFRSSDKAALQHYRFGLKTADFLLCRVCGVYVGAVIDTDNGKFGIINVRTLVPLPEKIAEVAPISYDREDAGDRVTRRETRWTPVLTLP